MDNKIAAGRLPVMLSAFVYPGAGQFVQKRWLAGMAWSVSFTVAFVVFVIRAFAPMIRNLQAALDWAADGSSTPFAGSSVAGVLIAFFIALLIYVANLVDVSRANRRLTRPPPPLPPDA